MRYYCLVLDCDDYDSLVILFCFIFLMPFSTKYVTRKPLGFSLEDLDQTPCLDCSAHLESAPSIECTDLRQY